MNDQDLDALFATARAVPVALCDALLERIVDDADATAAARIRPMQPAPGFWTTLIAAVGG